MGQAPSPTDVLAELLHSRGWTVAVAESLTSGAICAELGRGRGASEWFRGGIVAYSAQTKFDVLGVPPGPVVSPTAACAMADAVGDLFAADVSLAVTGVGGPGAESGTAAGTVWLAVRLSHGVQTHLRHFEGPPSRVVADTVEEAVRLLIRACRDPRSAVDNRSGHSAPAPASPPRPVSPPVAGDLAVTPTWAPRDPGDG